MQSSPQREEFRILSDQTVWRGNHERWGRRRRCAPGAGYAVTARDVSTTRRRPELFTTAPGRSRPAN